MRVALCLSGMVRTLMQAYPSIRQHLIEPFRPDIFIHTYDRMGNRKENDLPVSASWLSGLLRPISLKIQSYDEWAPEFKKERDRIYRYPGPIWCLGDAPESRWKMANALSQIRHVRECDLLRRDHEAKGGFSYDVVVRARMDNLFLETPNPFCAGKTLPEGTVFVPNHSCYGGVCDQFAMGTSAAMTAYSDYYVHFEAVYRSRVLLPRFWGPPENLLKRYLEKFAGLEVVSMPFAFEIQRDGEVELQSFKTQEYFLNYIATGLAL